MQGRIKGGGKLPLAPRFKGAPRDVVSNETAVWKIFVIQKRYKIATLYYIPNSYVVLSTVGKVE